MMILTVFRGILLAAPGVTAKRTGGVFINALPPKEPRPNVQIMMASAPDLPFTHQGPNSLLRSAVRVWSRGDTDRQAAELGMAAVAALNGWQGTHAGIWVNLIAKSETVSDYQEAAGVHRQIDTYDVHWRQA